MDRNNNILVTKTLFNTVVDSSTEASGFWGFCGGKTLWIEKDPGEKEREKRQRVVKIGNSSSARKWNPQKTNPAKPIKLWIK